MKKKVVEELIQDELNSQNIKTALAKILNPGIERETMINEFHYLHTLLSSEGSASTKVLRL